MQFKFSFTMISGNVYSYLADFDSRAVAVNSIKDAIGRNVITFDNEDILACRNIERVQITEIVPVIVAPKIEEVPDAVVRPTVPEVPQGNGKLGETRRHKGK